MFLRTLFLSFAALMPATASLAQQPNEGAYYCAAESSGGIVYNDRTKKWEGTNFRPFSKFTLKFKYVRTTPNGDEYAVTITPDGKNDVLQCYPYRTQFPQFDEFGYLICRTDFFNYKFNLKAGRFVEAYLMGYINGRDTNEDTPMLSAGTCTKIQ
jgi:hypothetical protein